MKARLDKVLATNGFGTRKTVKTLIKKHECIINGERITDPSFLIDVNTAQIRIDDTEVVLRTKIYLMINKPAGCVTSTDDPVNKTVMSYLKEPFSNMKLFPIGRLDGDTEGLIIITNDGALTHKLTSPKAGKVKSYYLELLEEPNDEKIQLYSKKMLEGVVFKDGYKCKPAKFEKCENLTGSEKQGFMVHITEGKYHQVKKMCLALGNKLTYLRRLSMGPISLDKNLELGEYRELTDEEIKLLNEV